MRPSAHQTSGMPGAFEAERFREDLYLHIIGTTTLMDQALKHDAKAITDAVENAARASTLHD